MKPFKAYTLTSSGIKVNTAHIDFDVPDGYRLYIDNEERSTIDVRGLGCVGWSKSWEVELRGCGPDDKAGASSGPQLGSVIWSVSLGRLNNGTSAGAIHLHEDEISSAIHTPGLLYYSGSSSEVEIIKTGGVLRQIKAPQALADIVILSASEYEVRLYQPSQVGAFSGLYAVAGNPLTAWRIRNPDAPSPNPTRVEFTLLNSTGEVTSVIEHSGASWTLNRAGNLYRETHLRTGNIKTVTVLNEDGTEALKRDEYFTSYAWGEEKTMEVNDPAGSPQTTVWQYNTDAAEEHAYGKLKSVTRPDGGWERYEYSSAAVNFGRLICIYRPWLNLPATPEEATETNGHCTLINYAHQGGSVFAAMPSLFEERILGVTVRKQTYTDVVTTATGMGLKSMKGKSLRQYLNYAESMLSSHLVYTSSSGANITPDWLQERPAQDTNKDGTRTVYSYVQGSFDEVARTFSPGTGLAVRGYAEQWKSGQYSGGVVGKSTRIESVMDGLGRKVFEETQVFMGGTNYAAVSRTDYFYDGDSERLSRTEKDGRITSSKTWAGPRLLSETDEQGVVTHYSNFDALGRARASTRAGVTTTTEFDALGRVKSTTRAAGALMLRSSTVYDLEEPQIFPQHLLNLGSCCAAVRSMIWRAGFVKRRMQTI